MKATFELIAILIILYRMQNLVYITNSVVHKYLLGANHNFNWLIIILNSGVKFDHYGCIVISDSVC